MSHDLSAIAAALQELPGVSAAVVDADPAGGVDALRLGLAPGVDGLAVAGAASRLVHERFGTLIDARQVQIVDATELPSAGPRAVPDAAPHPAPDHVPLGAGEKPLVPTQRGIRPEIVRTDLVTTGLEFSATVILSSQSRAATGDARGAATASGMNRAVAQATLRAVERLSRDSARTELEHIEVSHRGTERTVVVALTLVSSRGVERLTGAAVVRDDTSRAVVRATLDALNRRLEALLA